MIGREGECKGMESGEFLRTERIVSREELKERVGGADMKMLDVTGVQAETFEVPSDWIGLLFSNTLSKLGSIVERDVHLHRHLQLSSILVPQAYD